MIRRAALVVGVIFACVATEPSYAETIRFDREVVDIAPSDFDAWGTEDAGPGRWAVVNESVQGGHAFEQYRHEPAEECVALAIYQPFSGEHVEVAIRFKAVSGSLDQSAGVAVRLTTPDDYYVARASAMSHDVRLYRVVRGKFHELAHAPAPTTPREWHTLAVMAKGNHLSVALDGQPMLAATDVALRSPGKIVLWTKADSVTRFDQLEVRSLH